MKIMSGGTFDYTQYHLNDIIERIEEEIKNATMDKPSKVIRKGVTVYQYYDTSKSYVSTYNEPIDEIIKSYTLYDWNIVSELILGTQKIVTLNHPNKNYNIEIKEFEYEEYEDGEYYPEYSDKTIKEFKTAVKLLKLASIYVQRIDWLIAGDDGEETFHKRLLTELKELYNNSI